MPQDDFVESVIDTVAEVVPLSKPARQKIDTALRRDWRGMTPYIAATSQTRRQAIREATGTYAEISREFNVSVRTVARVRKGR